MSPCGESRELREQCGPTPRACVSGRDLRYRQRPVDAEIRIVVRNGEVLGGIVGAIDSIADVGRSSQRLEAMKKPGGYVEVSEISVIKPKCLLMAESGRILADIDQDVMHGTVCAAHQLGLPASGASVHAANDPLHRAGLGVLDERSRESRPPEMVVENLGIERPGEQSTLVVERFRGEDQHVHEACTFDAHMEMLS